MRDATPAQVAFVKDEFRRCNIFTHLTYDKFTWVMSRIDAKMLVHPEFLSSLLSYCQNPSYLLPRIEKLWDTLLSIPDLSNEDRNYFLREFQKK